MKIRRLVLILVSFLWLSGSLSIAQENPAESDWQFNLAPFYLWGFNIDGDLSVGSSKVPGDVPLSKPIEVPFGDVFDALEGAFIIHFETMYKSNWGLLVDIDYLDLGNDFTTSQGINLKVDFEASIAEIAGLYRIQQDSHNFDTILGFRGYKFDPGITLSNGPKVVDRSQEWLDPFVGGRWIWEFAEDWSVLARGDIGGFGLGSDFAWQAIGLVEWQPFKYASFLAGYRALDVNYEDGSGTNYFKFDATFYGPILGVNFKW